jgi:hypothetical protein
MDILELAKKAKKASSDKDKVRVAFDLDSVEHQRVTEFCNRNNLAIGKLAKILLIRFIEQQEKEKPKK